MLMSRTSEGNGQGHRPAKLQNCNIQTMAAVNPSFTSVISREDFTSGRCALLRSVEQAAMAIIMRAQTLQAFGLSRTTPCCRQAARLVVKSHRTQEQKAQPVRSGFGAEKLRSRTTSV